MRKDLCAEGLIRAIHTKFSKIQDTKRFTRESSISLTDCLMACFAVFSLKWPSLLQYEHEKKDPKILKNLKSLYHVDSPPSDTYMRERLDGVDPVQLRPAFKKVFSLLQRGKALEEFQYLDGYYLFSTDGTGHFSSSNVHCSNCCIKHHYDGKKTYYHNMMGGAIVHPDRREVIPFCPEMIKFQDGSKKNDCEQVASKRQLETLRKEHPHLKIIIVQDALSDSGPNIRLLESLSMSYIIVTKGQVSQWEDPSKVSCHEFCDEEGNVHKYRFINGIPLNGVHLDIKTNKFEHSVISPKGEKKSGAWITNIRVSKENVHQLMRGGRARWKIESAPQAHKETKLCA